MILLILVVIIMLTILIGAVLALAVTRLDKAVVSTAAAIEKQDKSYNPALTLGYKLPVQGDPDTQLKEARRIAAKQAAALPRGANMRIGNLREQMGKQPTAYDGVKEDPITAVKIATVHGWDGVRSGIVMGGAAPAATAAPGAPAAVAGQIELVPGKDYPVIEITDDMPDEEKRKARIANSKAKSAAMKAAKASGQTGVATAVSSGAAAAPTARTVAPAAAAGIPEPVMIEITDSMSADEVRKARIANSKAKAAYNKALKAAGVDPSAVGEAPAPTAVPAAAPAAPAADAAALAGIAKPDLIEITDNMSPDDVRKARIANSKATAAYNKALKAAGIDPSAAAAPAAPAAQPAPTAPAPAAPAAPAVDAAALAGIPKPDLIEITDDMPADEVRRARIANAKATSAYNKALKAAGIDPSTVG